MKTEKFINKAREIHGDLYGYERTEVINSKTPVIVTCKIHGDFSIRPSNHTSNKRGCNIGCSKKAFDVTRKDVNYFVNKARIKHGDTYDYSKVIYDNSLAKVVITCKIHGDFEQTPSNHYKYGCSKCGTLETVDKLRTNINTFSKTGFSVRAEGKTCIFYVIQCSNESENFYKIGITSNSVKRRFHSKSGMPYNFKLLISSTGDAESVWELELALKRKLNKNYVPKIKFAGSTFECYESLEEILNAIPTLL